MNLPAARAIEGTTGAAKAAATDAATIAVRPLEPRDIRGVARLFADTFLRGRATDDLERRIAQFYLGPTTAGGSPASLVHVDGEGRVDGFIGVTRMPFTVGDQPVEAAFCGALMVDRTRADPMAGARLLRAFVGGPQDISFSETANEVSVAMWKRLRGRVMPGHSLDWLKPIRPAAFAVDLVATRIPGLRLLKPLARPLDAVLSRLNPEPPRRPAGCSLRQVEEDEFAALLDALTSTHAVRPRWGEIDIAAMIGEAREKPRYGKLSLHAVRQGARDVGLVAWHSRPGGVLHVLQTCALPGRADAVIDTLLAHAAENGHSGLRGRTQPWMMEALMARGCMFLARTSTVVHARDAALLDAVLAGDVFVNGFAGESWSGLIGLAR